MQTFSMVCQTPEGQAFQPQRMVGSGFWSSWSKRPCAQKPSKDLFWKQIRFYINKYVFWAEIVRIQKKTQTWDFKVLLLLLLTHIYIIQPAACSTAKLVRQVKDLSAIWLVFSNVVSAVHFLLSLAIVLGFFFPSRAWHWPNVERLRLRLNVFSQ